MIKLSAFYSKAIILEKGAYLQSLTLGGTRILKESRDGVQTHGGSAILIPFAGRVRNGVYYFKGRKYKLPINDLLGHSIHGFVQGLDFNPDTKTSKSVSLSADIENESYPSKLKVNISYTIGANLLTSVYRIINSGSVSAPLHVGIHPYFEFYGGWHMSFSRKIYEIPNEGHLFPLKRRLPTRQEYDNETEYFNDHVFFYGGGDIRFHNGKITVSIHRHNMPYLTIYGGKFSESNSLAIEPQSAVADSYNNMIGLRIIKPGQEISFGIKIRVGE
jgi:aldose 1-epimerase